MTSGAKAMPLCFHLTTGARPNTYTQLRRRQQQKITELEYTHPSLEDIAAVFAFASTRNISSAHPM